LKPPPAGRLRRATKPSSTAQHRHHLDLPTQPRLQRSWHTDTRIARILLDERTGVVIETSIKEYLPNAAMRRFIQKRDGHCRFPGCARGARRCEPDHVIPFSQGGPTTPRNLVSECKHHHRVKHNAGWTLVMTREGICTVTQLTDPHGRQYLTHPTNHHELAA